MIFQSESQASNSTLLKSRMCGFRGGSGEDIFRWENSWFVDWLIDVFIDFDQLTFMDTQNSNKNTNSYCFTLSIFAGPFWVATRFRNCSGDLTPLWRQLVYSVMEIYESSRCRYVSLSVLHCKCMSLICENVKLTWHFLFTFWHYLLFEFSHVTLFVQAVII